MPYRSGGRRLVALICHATAAAAGGAIPFHPQPHAARFSHCYFTKRAATASNPESCHNTASYLVDSGGLSPAAAAAVVSRGMRIVSTAKADAVLALLRRYGFSDAQIALLIRQAPKLLLFDPDKVLQPKLEFFTSLGFPVRWLANKNILERSLIKHIIPGIEFLRGIIGTDANIRRAFRFKYALTLDVEKRMRPAVQALRCHGLSEDAISKLVLFQIDVLGLAPDRIARIIEDLEALGLPISDSRFVKGFLAMSSINRETWLRKVVLYQSLGVSEDELLRAFKTQPTIMLISDANLKKKVHFFLDELKLDISHVMRHPVLLGYSLEKCILPRCAVLSVLMREGQLERNINLLRALLGGSKIFLKRYVLRYADNIPVVVEAYEGKIKFEGFKDRVV